MDLKYFWNIFIWQLEQYFHRPIVHRIEILNAMTTSLLYSHMLKSIPRLSFLFYSHITPSIAHYSGVYRGLSCLFNVCPEMLKIHSSPQLSFLSQPENQISILHIWLGPENCLEYFDYLMIIIWGQSPSRYTVKVRSAEGILAMQFISVLYNLNLTLLVMTFMGSLFLKTSSLTHFNLNIVSGPGTMRSQRCTSGRRSTWLTTLGWRPTW